MPIKEMKKIIQSSQLFEKKPTKEEEEHKADGTNIKQITGTSLVVQW